MFQFITLDNIILFLNSCGIPILLVDLTSLQSSYLFYIGNAFYLFVLIFILSIAYKICIRIFNFII